MKKGKKLAVFALSALMAVGCAAALSACGEKETDYPTQIVNGGFEENADSSTWYGWTRDGSAFSARGVVEDATVNGVDVDKTGDRYFSGLDGGTQKMTGSLTSDPFLLTGTGKIAFKMGAAKFTDKIYVEFYEYGKDGAALLKIGNDDFDGTWITDQMIRKIADLSEHVGKVIYIKITDNDDDDDYGYVNLDDFVVCLTEDTLSQYERERETQLETYGEPYFEEDETSTDIQNGGFETGDLTGWKILQGTAFTKAGVVSTSQYYWTDRSVYGWGDYYFDGNNNGETLESAVGAMRSSKFTLAGDGYISFMIGAGKSGSYVAICDGNTDEELIKITNDGFNDPKTALMLLRVYVDASDYLGKVLYIKVVDDNGTSDFAFINVDDFRVSMTKEEVIELQTEQYRAVQEETYTSESYSDLVTIRSYYASYDYLFELSVLKFTNYASNAVALCAQSADLTEYLADVTAAFGNTEVTDISIVSVQYEDTVYSSGFTSFDLSVEGYYYVTYRAAYGTETVEATFTLVVKAGNFEVVNGGFETGDLTGWTVLTEGWSQTDGKYDGVINATTYWGEALPYNQSGNYHLDGWNTGIAEADGWTIRSSNFLLGGSGWITVKMGGNAAAVKVYKADGTLIGYYKQTRFSDANFPYLSDGGSWADMAVYAMDLSEYIGEELYIDLCDEVINEGWAHAWFDDVITYYETAPDYENLYDTVMDGNNSGEVNIHWVLAVNALVKNSGFETGDLTGWTVLTEGWGQTDGKYDGVINATTYWGEALPYNQSGNYHLDGWNTGIAEADGWTIRSSNFMLYGSGWITVKMGGNAAAVKVYKADGSLIGYYKQTRFSDANFPYLSEGGSWADMAVYAIDLSAYVGEELYIELCDEVINEGWAHAWFDDVITYYETAPDYANLYDTVMDGNNSGEVNIHWVLAVNLLNHEESSDE